MLELAPSPLLFHLSYIHSFFHDFRFQPSLQTLNEQKSLRGGGGHRFPILTGLLRRILR
jgi:hypothetical protein